MAHTITVHADTTETTIRIVDGQTLLSAFQQSGWHFSAPCGGIGRCGKCLVTIHNPEAAGKRHADEDRWLGSDPTKRLACRCTPTGDLEVTIPAGIHAPAAVVRLDL